MHSDTENKEVRNDVEEDDIDDIEDVDPEHTVVMAEDTFSDPDISMEVNVEKLVAELENAADDDVHRKAEIRRRLEEIAEESSLEDTYAIDLDDD